MKRDEIHFGTPTTDNVNSYLLLRTLFNVLVITFGVCTTLSLALRLWSFIWVLCAKQKSTGAKAQWSGTGDGENAINARIITCWEKNQPPTQFVCNLFILWFGAVRYVWFGCLFFLHSHYLHIKTNISWPFSTLKFCNS